jgi:hypothetical protein
MAVERGILFSGPMVRAILRPVNPKTVTRRLSKQWLKVKAGDRLWVRETHSILDMRADVELAEGPTPPTEPFPASVTYLADDEERGFTVEPADWRESFDADHIIGRPSIHMPRWASRILLECEEDTRAERLQDITEEEARMEGVDRYVMGHGFVTDSDCSIEPGYVMYGNFRRGFEMLWGTLHTKPGERWEDNPVVYRVGRFHRVEVQPR